MKIETKQNSVSNHELERFTFFPAGRVMSGQLLGSRAELIIEHDGREYRLRLTQKRKLILTA